MSAAGTPGRKRPVARVFVAAVVALVIGVIGIALLSVHSGEPISRSWHLWVMAVVGILGGLYFLVAAIARAVSQRDR
ncbi:hypothetical protein [Herbiconiux sp.]|uniref:hypothetical protein n=1 Tax=Herbiconiux sp. TaxID=1871186 RepID=UPI0025C698DC|nr:hypothetical protein [Herbiconiux sp.]